MPNLTDPQLARYARHILLPDIDLDGQARLLKSHALIIGCGGLGAAAIPYLAASGVGHLILVDDDEIELSNLQRQVAYRTKDVGRVKAQAMGEYINALNLDVQVSVVVERVDAASLAGLLGAVEYTVDVVLDCTDNFATRHVINQACVGNQVPLVSGSATRFDGQWTVFDARRLDSPCYACAFPNTGAIVTDGACATMGIFAPLVGMVGAHQAGLALAVLLNWADIPVGQLFTLNAHTQVQEVFQLARNLECKVCGN